MARFSRPVPVRTGPPPKTGAQGGTRTHGQLLTRQLLYQLSYTRESGAGYRIRTGDDCLEDSCRTTWRIPLKLRPPPSAQWRHLADGVRRGDCVATRLLGLAGSFKFRHRGFCFSAPGSPPLCFSAQPEKSPSSPSALAISLAGTFPAVIGRPPRPDQHLWSKAGETRSLHVVSEGIAVRPEVRVPASPCHHWLYPSIRGWSHVSAVPATSRTAMPASNIHSGAASGFGQTGGGDCPLPKAAPLWMRGT